MFESLILLSHGLPYQCVTAVDEPAHNDGSLCRIEKRFISVYIGNAIFVGNVPYPVPK